MHAFAYRLCEGVGQRHGGNKHQTTLYRRTHGGLYVYIIFIASISDLRAYNLYQSLSEIVLRSISGTTAAYSIDTFLLVNDFIWRVGYARYRGELLDPV